MEGYTEADFEDIKKCLSVSRLAPYQEISEFPYIDTAITLYNLMQMQSSLLFLPLQYLEVCLRNRINDALTEYYRSRSSKVELPGLPEEWYLWLPESEKTKASINEACERARKDIRGRLITSGDIISRLNFGIWRHILRERADNQDKLYFWSAVIRNIFPNTQHNKDMIMQTLGNITVLRNRLFHYEPIWKSHSGSKDIDSAFSELEKKYGIVHEFIGWMSYPLQKYINKNALVFKVISEDVKSAILLVREKIRTLGE